MFLSQWTSSLWSSGTWHYAGWYTSKSLTDI